MRNIFFLFALLCLEKALHAQYIYTIKADSVKITNSCDTAELIIENHTQTVPGFLYNKGRGRTEFRRAMMKINDSIYVVGGDTIKLSVAWLQGGNTFGTTGYFGTRDNNHIDFYTNGIKRGRWTNTGNFLVGGETDYGYKMAVDGAIYGQYFTNSTTPLGAIGSGALRLRWGGGEGSYIDFYNSHENNNRRGFISSGSDGRPLNLYDQIGLSLATTPFLSVGTEWPTAQNTKFSLTTAFNSTQDPMRVANLISADGLSSTSYLRVKASGNTILGEGDDNGYKLQVNGNSWVRDYHTIGFDSYKIQLSANYNHAYGEGITGSMLIFGSPNLYATIGVNKQAVGNIPEQSLIIGGVSPGHYTTLVDYARNPAFVVDGNGAVTINGGHSGITNGVGVGTNANAIRFDINGGRGTGTGTVGDIYFSTGNAQVSGSTMHSLTTRWIIKGGTGYLSNHSNPKSLIGINGDNGYSQLRLRTSYTPTSTADTNGNTGDFSWDDDFFYIKTSEGWKRSALSTF